MSPVSGSTEIERYTYTADGDAAWGVLNSTNARLQRTMVFPAGDYTATDPGLSAGFLGLLGAPAAAAVGFVLNPLGTMATS